MLSNTGWDDVLSFWFGKLDENGDADAEHAKIWWNKDPDFDAFLRDRFLGHHHDIVAGKRQEWLATPRGRLATIIILDQFSRNMFRDTPEMFANDALAVKTTLEGVEAGDDRALACDERVFFCMPLMHSEDIAHQDRSVEIFAALAKEYGGPPSPTPSTRYNTATSSRASGDSRTATSCSGAPRLQRRPRS